MSFTLIDIVFMLNLIIYVVLITISATFST